MLELYIIRHGLAGKNLEDPALDDERQLKKKGKEKMADIAKCLKERKIHFDNVLTSPLPRSKQTADIINSYCGEVKDVQVTDLLKPGASFDNLIKFLNKFKKSKKIAIVGHEPFLSGFASYCISKDKTSLLNLKKGGVLMLEVNEVIEPGKCVLSLLMQPRHII